MRASEFTDAQKAFIVKQGVDGIPDTSASGGRIARELTNLIARRGESRECSFPIRAG
ncbi:hypothetical protein [Mesorhizobium sp.]|uniref:hypothetical protein n=1 Tax=Mesorhizobium sp. TaxID=1871066 RepID=UPI00257BF23C|nr:hypothetical protein [Mesorhizobium sp.]